MGVLIQKEQLKIGDHIYSWRRLYIYAHHGIYVGDGKVIHFSQAEQTGTASSASSSISRYHCPLCGDQSRLSGVRSSCLDCFLCGGDLYRFEYGVNIAVLLSAPRNDTCTLASAEPVERVLHRANFLLANNGFRAYDFFKNNCIDFAIYCKTGLIVDDKFSVRRFAQVTTKVLAASTLVLAASTLGFAGYYFSNRVFSDIGVRPDAIRIAVEDLVNARR